jgi:Bifunctional DNA primase/polymerase, N-terminal
MPVPSLVGEPTRIESGVLLAALGDLELGRAAEVYAALGYPVLPVFEPNPDGGCTCRAGAGCDRAGKHPRITGGVWQPPPTRPWCAAGGAAGPPPTWRCAPACASTSLMSTANPVWRRSRHPDQRRRAARLRAVGAHRRRGLAPAVHPTGYGSPKRVLPGVDWRGRGGYVLVAPSVHPSGRRYRWVRPLTLALPQAPAELRALLAPPPPPAPRPLGPAVAAIGGGYGPAALAAESARVRATPPGGRGRRGRNDALNRAAFKLGQLVHAGVLDEALVRAELLDAAIAAGLELARSARTIDKAMTAARAKPPATPARRVLLR